MTVHLLATCRKSELLPFTELVFKTLRIGFPSLRVKVYLNNVASEHKEPLLYWIDKVKATWTEVNTTHHEWISQLLKEETEPFWICDTDVIFYDRVEHFTTDKALLGYRIPEWFDTCCGAMTRARLHTSLMLMNPGTIIAQLEEYKTKIFHPICNPHTNFINPCAIPFKNKAYFYDTCGLLYHAIGGQSFTDEQKETYFHFNFGTNPDLVLPRLQKDEATLMKENREFILCNPHKGKGLWRLQEEYYANHRM